MARSLFSIEGGLKILGVNSADDVDVIFGADAPGIIQQEIDAPVGSMYLRLNGQQYQKVLAGTGLDKWKKKLDADDLLSISPRSEKVIGGTGDAAPVFPATIDLVANPFSDDDAPTLAAADYSIGDHQLFGIGGVPVLAKVTAVSAPDVTFAAADTPLADNDYFMIQSYLPDASDDQEKQALVQYVNSTIYKVGDVNWDFADGINLTTSYSAAVGDVNINDTVESAIAKLDGVNDAQDQALGLAQGAVNFGAFTGSFLADNQNAKALFQALETEAEASRTSLGIAVGALNFGTFTGSILTDSSSAKTLFQELENAVEGIAYQKKLVGVTTEVTLDEVNVDEFHRTVWEVKASLDSDPERYESFTLAADHNGTASADASAADDTKYAKLKRGATFDFNVGADLSGAGAAQTLRLRVSASAAVTVRARRIAVEA